MIKVAQMGEKLLRAITSYPVGIRKQMVRRASVSGGKATKGDRATTTLDQALGKRVRRRRVELRLSQAALAERLGVACQQVQKYEGGKNRIAVSRLIDIATALDAPVSYFISGLASSRGGRDGDFADPPVTASTEGAEMFRLFGRVTTAAERQRILAVVRALVEQR